MASKKAKQVNRKFKLSLKKKSRKNMVHKKSVDGHSKHSTNAPCYDQKKMSSSQAKEIKITKENTAINNVDQSSRTKLLPVSQAENFFSCITEQRNIGKPCAKNSNKKTVSNSKQNIKRKTNDNESENKDEIIKLLKEKIVELEREKLSIQHQLERKLCTEKFHSYDNDNGIDEESDVHDNGKSVHDVNPLQVSSLCGLNKEIVVVKNNFEENAFSESCKNCLRVFRTKYALTKHKTGCKMKSYILQKCSNCDKEFRNDKLYLSHLKRCDRYKKLKELRTNVHFLENNGHGNDSDDFSDLFPKAFTQSKVLEIDNYQCHHCSTVYYSKTSFQKHLKHNVCGNMSKRILCTYEDCNIKFTRYDHFLLHLPYYHNDITYLSKVKYFRSFSSFEEWKAHEQNQTLSYLIKSRGSKKYKGTEYSYYECQFNAVCDGKRGGKRKTERRRKAGVIDYIFCPARMTVIRDMATNILCVNYIEKHSHELTAENVKHQRFPKTIVNEITAKLKKGMTPHEILEFYKNDMNKPNSSLGTGLKMTNLISLQFIKGLKWKFLQQDNSVHRELEEVTMLDKTREEESIDSLDEPGMKVEEYYEVKFEEDSVTPCFKLIPTAAMNSQTQITTYDITAPIADNDIDLVRINTPTDDVTVESIEMTEFDHPEKENVLSLDDVDSKIIDVVIIKMDDVDIDNCIVADRDIQSQI